MNEDLEENIKSNNNHVENKSIIDDDEV